MKTLVVCQILNEVPLYLREIRSECKAMRLETKVSSATPANIGAGKDKSEMKILNGKQPLSNEAQHCTTKHNTLSFQVSVVICHKGRLRAFCVCKNTNLEASTL